MNDNDTLYASPFEQIRKVSEDGIEYWSARDLAKILGYAQYNKFTNAIEKAEEACRNSGQPMPTISPIRVKWSALAQELSESSIQYFFHAMLATY